MLVPPRLVFIDAWINFASEGSELVSDNQKCQLGVFPLPDKINWIWTPDAVAPNAFESEFKMSPDTITGHSLLFDPSWGPLWWGHSGHTANWLLTLAQIFTESQPQSAGVQCCSERSILWQALHCVWSSTGPGLSPLCPRVLPPGQSWVCDHLQGGMLHRLWPSVWPTQSVQGAACAVTGMHCLYIFTKGILHKGPYFLAPLFYKIFNSLT